MTFTPSAQQQAIYTDVAQGRGHTVVLARAGTGKTTTILEAMRHVPQGKTTLVVAFNKAIAAEMSRRLEDRGVDCGFRAAVNVRTLHSYGFSAIRRAAGSIELDTKGKRDFKWLDERLGSNRELALYKGAIVKLVSLAKGALADTENQLDDLIDAHGIDDLDNRSRLMTDALWLMGRARDTALEGGLITFDDMIWLPVVCGLRTWKYDRIFVDETQDLNACQLELILRALRKGGRICAVGDDRQAIYRFRGADENAVGNLVNRLDAKILKLTTSYRCAKAIASHAQEFCPDFEAHENNPRGAIEHCSVNHIGKWARAGDFVLSRTNAPLIKLCLQFLAEGRAANIQGRDVGAGLIALIRKSGAATTQELGVWLDKWSATECARLLAKDPPSDTASVTDRADALFALMEGLEVTEAVINRIEDLFSDKKDRDRIILSSTHKAKGLERDRVFVLADTYLKTRKNTCRHQPSRGWQSRFRRLQTSAEMAEERNLYYVAVTRARVQLYLVEGEV